MHVERADAGVVISPLPGGRGRERTVGGHEHLGPGRATAGLVLGIGPAESHGEKVCRGVPPPGSFRRPRDERSHAAS